MVLEIEIPSPLVATLAIKSHLPKDAVTLFTQVPKAASTTCSMHPYHELGSRYKTMHEAHLG